MPSIMMLLLFLILHTDATTGEHHCAPCHCEKLKADCTNKSLNKIPPGIPTNITGLVFRNNSLNLTSQTFKGFKHLKTLDISWNNIRVLPKGSFQGLKNLTSLNMDHNPFSYGDFSCDLFRPLQKLLQLRIQRSNSSRYPDKALQTLSSLKSLYIDGLDQLFGREFRNLKNLVKLQINGQIGSCNITMITKNTFMNMRFLRELNIVHCKRLYIIEKGSFARIKDLTVLNISHNQCVGMEGLTNATEGISNTSIQILVANHIEQHFPLSVIVPERLGLNLNNTELRVLSLDDNKISGCELHTLQFLPKTLKTLSIKGNRLEFSPYLIYFPSLRITDLDLSESRLFYEYDVPETLRGLTGECLYVRHGYKRDVLDEGDSHVRTNKDILKYSLNNLSGNISIGLPGNLTTIKYSGVGLRLHLKTIRLVQNKVKFIDLSYNLISAWIGPIYGFNELAYLNLSANRANYIGEEFFDNFPSLMNLDISYNYIGRILSNDEKGSIFKNLSSLKVLNLTENLISYIPRKAFYWLNSIEVLILSHNQIYFVDFMYPNNLVHLDLSYNEITWLRLKFIHDIKKQAQTKNVFLYLGKNLLSCTCESLQTIKLIAESNVDFGNISSYMCMLSNDSKYKFRNKMDVTNLYMKIEYSCRYFSTLLGVTAAVSLILCVIIGGVVHRYRWKLRYWYFAAKYRYNSSNENSQEFRYDAFISYGDEDRGFVVNDMVNKLESDEGFMLNIHQRDFTPGRSIAENIIEAIQTSRRTVCILSRSFLESYWCMYELQMANMERVTTGRDVLLIIMMEEIPLKDIPAEILYYIQTNSYLEYPADGNEDLFWRNLNVTLKT